MNAGNPYGMSTSMFPPRMPETEGPGQDLDKGRNYMLSSSNFYPSAMTPPDRPLIQSSNIDESKKHTIVCTHWLKNLCKKGENWEFLHSYDPSKMPICKYYQNGNCKNENWQYLHIDARGKTEWPYYARGFCKNGMGCKNAHTEKQLCEDYLYGFCIKGPNWEKVHLKSLVSTDDDKFEVLANIGVQAQSSTTDTKAICHRCGNRGHKSDRCENKAISKEELQVILVNDPEYMRKAKNVVWYRCKKIGHYPIIWDLVTKREQERMAGGEGGVNSMFSAGRSNTVMIDGVAVPSTFGPSMGTALNTIYTWEQIFNSIMKYYNNFQ